MLQGPWANVGSGSSKPNPNPGMLQLQLRCSKSCGFWLKINHEALTEWLPSLIEFLDLRLAHNAVKHKPLRPPEFAKTFQVKVWNWLCLGSGRETRWDTEVRWLLCQLPTRSWPQAVEHGGPTPSDGRQRVRCFQFASGCREATCSRSSELCGVQS